VGGGIREKKVIGPQENMILLVVPEKKKGALGLPSWVKEGGREKIG